MRRKRHIEIFSISALDLFASALGAFILVAIILFPYYLKDQAASSAFAAADSEKRDLRSRLEAASRRLAALEAQAAPAETVSASPDAATPFLVVLIKWTTASADVDLHIVDPAGHEFDWFRSNRDRRDFPSTKAELSFDMTAGPGIEAWQDPAALPGAYTIYYVANELPEGLQVEVRGTVYDRLGRHDVPVRVLRFAKERVLAAVIDILKDGHATIQ